MDDDNDNNNATSTIAGCEMVWFVVVVANDDDDDDDDIHVLFFMDVVGFLQEEGVWYLSLPLFHLWPEPATQCARILI